MKKEKDFSEKMGSSKKKALESLSDDEILQGFKDADAENDGSGKGFYARNDGRMHILREIDR